jgi:ABC-type Zn uptake system ZnuABC Zn-binding protein ZnuA
MKKLRYVFLPLFVFVLAACQPTADVQKPPQNSLQVVVVESFLADIVHNIAGERLEVETLMPSGLDPHSFEPTPKDVAKISDSDILFINGAGLEEWLEDIIENLPEDQLIITASAGLESRIEAEEGHEEGEVVEEVDEHDHEYDPHFWLNPLLVVKYVENIRDGLIRIDPEGSALYTANAETYIQQLIELDQYIEEKITQIPVDRRLIVTNHESFGYFADRYGFTIVGTILKSVSSGASPSALQMAELVDQMRSSGASAIFMETGSNPELAEQLSNETGIKVVYDLYTHSISEEGGNAPNYIELMKYNVEQIINALAD